MSEQSSRARSTAPAAPRSSRKGRKLASAAALAACLAGCGAAERDDGGEPAAGSPGAGAQETLLAEITGEAGIDFVHDSGVDGSYFMPEHIGSGGALFDADGDGDLDLYLVDSGGHSGNPADARPNRFYRQEADGRFVDRTQESGLGDLGYGMGVAVGDADGDGDPDVYVTNHGPDALYENLGDGTFRDVTATAGLELDAWSTSACFFDADADGDLDLYVVTYLDYAPKPCTDSAGRPEYCGPTAFPGVSDALFANRGDGTFEDAGARAGIAAVRNRGLGVACVDLDGDGRQDVYVANDGELNQLWIQREDGRFEDRAVPAGAAVNAAGAPEAGMGVSAGDADGDLDLDLVVAHLDRETNTLYENLGGGSFQDATGGSGLGPPSLPYTGFGTAFLDADLDADLDLLVANGRVGRGPRLAPERAGEALSDYWRDYAEPNLYLENLGGGRFRAAAAAAGALASRVEVSRALVPGDLDLDGDLDAVLTNCNGPARLYRNLAEGRGGWLAVRIRDAAGRRDAIGAVVVATAGGRRQLRAITATEGYLTAVEPVAHFGLGSAGGPVRLEVTWPDGARESHQGLDPDRRYVVLRSGAGGGE